MYSYRTPAQISGFGYIKSSYGQFKFDRGYEQFCGFWPLCTNNYMTNLCSLY